MQLIDIGANLIRAADAVGCEFKPTRRSAPDDFVRTGKHAPWT